MVFCTTGPYLSVPNLELLIAALPQVSILWFLKMYQAAGVHEKDPADLSGST